MKFIHIADIHLGATPDSNMPWGKDRSKEIWQSFQYIIECCNRESVDLLLIAGDLFHRQPLLKELKEVNYYFSKLVTTRVVLIAGNHDYIGARSHYQGFDWDPKVHMFQQNTLETITYPELGTTISGFSYCVRDITESLYDSIRPSERGGIQILLAHGGDEKNIPINKKKLQQAGFHYIALGHIHKHEILSERMAYAGSLEPLDKNEIGSHGYIFGEIDLDGETRISFIPSSLREYKRITLAVDLETTNGSLQDHCKDVIRKNGDQHIYQLTLRGFRDEHIHFDQEALKQLGHVYEVVDETVPDYDFDALYRDNGDNMIGLFIQRIRERAGHDEVARKALYYGIEALLSAKDVR